MVVVMSTNKKMKNDFFRTVNLDFPIYFILGCRFIIIIFGFSPWSRSGIMAALMFVYPVL